MKKTKTSALTLKNDILFQELFAKKGNEYLLKSFLKSLLTDFHIHKVTVAKQVNLPRSEFSEKLSILDLKATLDENTIVNLEMQRVKDNYIIPRATYYSSKILANELQASQNYSSLKKVITIVFLDYVIFPHKGYITETKLIDKCHKDQELNEYQKYYFIELPKFRKEKLNLDDPLSAWLTFIDGENKEGVKKVMEKYFDIKKAMKELEYLTGDEEKRKIADLKERAILDYNSHMRTSFEDGQLKGEKRGLKKGKIEMIMQMLRKKMDLKLITELSGFSENEIRKIELQNSKLKC